MTFALTAVLASETPAPEAPAATCPVSFWARLVEPVSGRLLDASPTLIEYVPAWASHWLSAADQEARSWMVSGKVTVALCPGVERDPLEARELLRRVLAGGRVADVHLRHVRARHRPGVGDRRGHRGGAVGVERADVEVGERELRVGQPEPERERGRDVLRLVPAVADVHALAVDRPGRRCPATARWSAPGPG